LADLSFHSIVDDDFTILCYLDLSYNQIIILSDSNFRKSTISFSGGNVSVAWYQQNEYCLVFAAMRLNNVLFKDCIKYANEDPSEDLYEDPNENQRKNRYIPLVHILDSNVIIRNEQGDSLNLEISTIQQQAFDSVCIYQFICHTPLWSTSHTPLLSTGALARVRIWSATFLGSSISNGVCAFSRIRQILITAEDIGIRSFYFSHIREIIFSNRVRSIGYQAFSECNNLESVVFEPGTDNRPISTDGFVRREPFQGKSIDLYIYDYAFFKSPICLVWLPARLTHLGSHSLWNVSDVTFHMDCAPECVDPRAVGETTVSLRGPSNVLSGLSPAKSCHITVTDPPRRGDRYSQ
jgi:hypothetical protein